MYKRNPASFVQPISQLPTQQILVEVAFKQLLPELPMLFHPYLAL
jgi:hypothetical protein